MTSILGNTRKADITFYSSGRIDITAHLAKLLALHYGDVIDIMIEHAEYYLYVKHRAPTVGRHDATVYPSNAKGNNYRACSKKLCSAILYQCEAKGQVKLCAGTPDESHLYGIVVPIITKLIIL
ncbi:MAG: hypothetical protein RSA66_10360 [Muribaculaceae bacterium]